ncbi:MAG: hypothetical protein ACKV2T_37485 [Kofleriaceae bacterium]
MRSLLGMLVVACGSSTPITIPPPAPPAPPPAPPMAAPSLLVIPPPAPIAASKQICSPARQPPATTGSKQRVYDFTPMKLAPNGSGAIPAGFRRHPDSIRAAISAEADSIASCVQDAWRRGARPSRHVFGPPPHFGVVASFVVDPFGVPTQITVDGDGDVKMHECLRGVLQLARVARRTARETTVKVPLFLLGEHRGAKPLPTPAPVRATARNERAGCVRALDPLPRDTVELPEVVIEWLPGAYSNPRMRCNHRGIDKTQIRREMETHRYAFEACFAATPDARGRLDLEFVIGPHGVPTIQALRGAGTPALHTCITTAMTDVGFTRTDDPIRVNWAFTFESEAAPTFTDDCAGRAAWIATLSVHDPRAWTALDALAAAKCELPESLDRFARFDVPDMRADLYRGRGTTEAIDASTRLLAAFPAATRLLLFLAEAQLSVGREADARASFLRFLQLGTRDAARIERAAEGYARAVADRERLSPIDFCEESAPY